MSEHRHRIEVGLSSPPDRDTLVADLMVGQIQIAEVSGRAGGYQVEMYGGGPDDVWPLDLGDLISALQDAAEQLGRRRDGGG